MDWFLWLALLLAAYFLVTTFLVHRLGGDAPGWRVRCSSCGKTKPAGEVGVIRIGAIGTKYTLGKCSRCGGLRWIVIERDPES